MRDVDWGAIAYKAEELRCDVLVYTDAARCCWAMFEPASVEAVGWFEFTPVGHWCTFEAPARWFFTEVCFSYLSTFVCVAMGISAALSFFIEDTEVTSWSRGASFPYRYRHDEKRL